MPRTRHLTWVAICGMAAGMAGAQEPPVRPFGDGWQRVVPVPMPELGPGDRYVIWVEGGWLQARRQTAAGVIDWHVVLARASGPEPPVVSAPQGTPRFEVSYRGGRYFIREDANLLRCLREPKTGDGGAWPRVAFSPDRHQPAGSAGSPDHPPMLRGWTGERGFFVTSSAGPTDDQFDCLVRLSPGAKREGYGYETLHGSPLRRAFYGRNWVLDDGQLLVAQRGLEALSDAGPDVGDPAPPLVAKTLDGEPLALGDYRGKYVLLDFWATWCTPCVAEIPHLKGVYEAFGKDERFVMIGLSLDEEIEAPRRFVKDRDIPWVQVFLGGGAESSVARHYGVESIPATFLIGPDGKVIARDVRGEKLKEVVSQALRKE
jgi:thiol-disulfide isomerase/thioredoxin